MHPCSPPAIQPASQTGCLSAFRPCIHAALQPSSHPAKLVGNEPATRFLRLCVFQTLSVSASLCLSDSLCLCVCVSRLSGLPYNVKNIYIYTHTYIHTIIYYNILYYTTTYYTIACPQVKFKWRATRRALRQATGDDDSSAASDVNIDSEPEDPRFLLRDIPIPCHTILYHTIIWYDII